MRNAQGRVGSLLAILGLMLAFWPPFGPAIQAAVAADPVLAAGAVDAGTSLLQAKKFPEAEAEFRKALAGNPNEAKALDGLGQALEGQNKFDEAAKVYETLANNLTHAAAVPPVPTAVKPLSATLAPPAAGAAPPPAPASPATAAPMPTPAGPVSSVLGPPKVGEVIDVRDSGGSWYKSTVLKVNGDKRFIHYEGWGDNWNEWVTPDHVRPLTAGITAPKNLSYPTALGAPGIGEVLHAQDRNGQWHQATVWHVDGDKRLVHYQGWASTTNEWVAPDRVKALTAAEIKAATTRRTLDGWYVKTEITASGGSRLKCTYYWFRPDGKVYFGSPFANGATDFAAAQKAEPKNCGTYQIIGEDMTLQKSGADPESHTYSPGAGGVMDNSPLSPVVRFTDGTTLDGTWGIDYSGTFGGVHAISSNSWVFHADGTFEHTRVGGVETIAHHTGTGAAPGNAVAVDAPIEKGKYAFTGGMLKITADDGRTQTLAAWGVGSQKDPSPLGIDGIELNHQR